MALRTEVQNWRWAGVPFYLQAPASGWTNSRPRSWWSSIRTRCSHAEGVTTANRLRHPGPARRGMRPHPDRQGPGPGGIRLRPVSLDLSYATAFEQQTLPDAYERLLMDVIQGNATLFMRRDEVEAAWAGTEPILQRWAVPARAPEALRCRHRTDPPRHRSLERDGRSWQEPDQ